MKTILITGTSTGLGFAAAVALARAGHDVFATMRNPARSPELQTLATNERLPITIVPLDVDSDDSVSNGVAKILALRGRIDVLINNAGIGPLGSVEETPLAEHRQVIETNYFGTLRCIQAVLPGMRERRAGQIVNISSVAGKLATPGQSAYCASKFAVEALSECLASEVRPFNIRVNIVEPGVIETPIFGKLGDLGNLYPGARRLNAIFGASLENPVPASVIGDLLLDLVANENWTLRHPGGPAAAAIMASRAASTDEQVIAFNALDDDTWCDVMQNQRGLNVRAHMV
jgi:NAD(P)-dependent dehydrogenase (short-subunit alcohol dehydrogenase family)